MLCSLVSELSLSEGGHVRPGRRRRASRRLLESWRMWSRTQSVGARLQMRLGGLESRVNQLRASIEGVGVEVVVLSCTVPGMRLGMLVVVVECFTYGSWVFSSGVGRGKGGMRMMKVRRSEFSRKGEAGGVGRFLK
jgi:hypothetical protein